MNFRSIAIGILRFIASGAIAAGIGLALLNLSKNAFFVAYMGAGFVPMLLLLPLDAILQVIGYPMHVLLAEQGMEGPDLFAALIPFGGFLFWWVAIFAAWTYFARRTGNPLALPHLIVVSGLIVFLAGLLAFLSHLATPHPPSPNKGGIAFGILLLGGFGFPLLWWGLVRLVLKLFPSLRRRRREPPPLTLVNEVPQISVTDSRASRSH